MPLDPSAVPAGGHHDKSRLWWGRKGAGEGAARPIVDACLRRHTARPGRICQVSESETDAAPHRSGNIVTYRCWVRTERDKVSKRVFGQFQGLRLSAAWSKCHLQAKKTGIQRHPQAESLRDTKTRTSSIGPAEEVVRKRTEGGRKRNIHQELWRAA